MVQPTEARIPESQTSLQMIAADATFQSRYPDLTRYLREKECIGLISNVEAFATFPNGGRILCKVPTKVWEKVILPGIKTFAVVTHVYLQGGGLRLQCNLRWSR